LLEQSLAPKCQECSFWATASCDVCLSFQGLAASILAYCDTAEEVQWLSAVTIIPAVLICSSPNTYTSQVRTFKEVIMSRDCLSPPVAGLVCIDDGTCVSYSWYSCRTSVYWWWNLCFLLMIHSFLLPWHLPVGCHKAAVQSGQGRPHCPDHNPIGWRTSEPAQHCLHRQAGYYSGVEPRIWWHKSTSSSEAVCGWHLSFERRPFLSCLPGQLTATPGRGLLAPWQP
jgi:hypothetical protein